MTTLNQYTQTNELDHELAKRVIARTLANEARGRPNAISSADLAERTPVSASTVRDLIPEVMREYCLPVGMANGYFVIERKAEYARQVDRQLRQAETSRERARLISSTFNRTNGDTQLTEP